MSWKEDLPAEYKDQPWLQNVESQEDLLKAHAGAQKMIGAEKIPVPTSDTDPHWNVVYDRLGRPKASTDYKLPTIEGLPEGFQIEPTKLEAFQKKAHELGLNNRQTSALYQDYVQSQTSQYKQAIDQQTQARDAADKALRAELGQGYEANIDLANKTMQYMYGDKSKEVAAKYGNDPDFIRGMIKAGNELSEDVLGAGAPKPLDLTPDAAQKEINGVYGNTEHAYHNASHPDHDYWVHTRMPQLMGLVHPGDMEG